MLYKQIHTGTSKWQKKKQKNKKYVSKITQPSAPLAVNTDPVLLCVTLESPPLKVCP